MVVWYEESHSTCTLSRHWHWKQQSWFVKTIVSLLQLLYSIFLLNFISAIAISSIAISAIEQCYMRGILRNLKLKNTRHKIFPEMHGHILPHLKITIKCFTGTVLTVRNEMSNETGLNYIKMYSENSDCSQPSSWTISCDILFLS